MHTTSQGKSTGAIQTLMESKPEPFNSQRKPTRAISTLMESQPEPFKGKPTTAIQTLKESQPEQFKLSWKASQSHSISH
jgi:hypothetical protein